MRYFWVIQDKGGVAKTTTAMHLGDSLARKLKTTVVVVDGDSNRSGWKWARRADPSLYETTWGKIWPGGEVDIAPAVRIPGTGVAVVRDAAVTGMDYVPKVRIVDTRASVSDDDLEVLGDLNASGKKVLAILPTTPEPLSIQQLVPTARRLEKYRIKLAVLVVRAPSGSRAAADTFAALEAEGILHFPRAIPATVHVQRGPIHGVLARHLHHVDSSADRSLCRRVTQAYDAVVDELGIEEHF